MENKKEENANIHKSNSPEQIDIHKREKAKDKIMIKK